MEWARFGNQYVLRLMPGEELMETLCDFVEREEIPGAYFLAFGAFERAASTPELTFVLFAPAAKAFRQSPYFKQFVRDRGIEAYWRDHGFPPSCRASGARDFACE